MRLSGWLLLLVVAVVGLGLMSSVQDAREGTPGDPAVYEQIRQETDCQVLQEGLARNERDAARRYDQRSVDGLYAVVRSYARDHQARIDELDC